MSDQIKNIMISLFVLAACAIVVFIIVFLHPGTGDELKTLRVRFNDIDKITVGTRVTYGGKPVGEVAKIIPLNVEDRKKITKHDEVYVYELILHVDSGVEVFSTDLITARTSGLLGEKSVAIMPMPWKKDEHPKEITSEIVYAEQTSSVEDSLKQFRIVANRMEKALRIVNELLDEVKEREIVKNISDTILLAKSTMQHANNIAAAVDQPQKIQAIIDQVKLATGYAVTFIDSINTGEGTIAKLIRDEDIYLRVTALFNKVETIANDVNHYGLLFHLDKSWQRLRARRMNLLGKLSSPQEFRNFFNDEIDQISTSLSRVGMVLEQKEGMSCCDDTCYAFEFEKVFGELLRRVEGLEEELKLYNIQLNDQKVELTELNSNGCCINVN